MLFQSCCSSKIPKNIFRYVYLEYNEKFYKIKLSLGVKQYNHYRSKNGVDVKFAWALLFWLRAILTCPPKNAIL